MSRNNRIWEQLAKSLGLLAVETDKKANDSDSASIKTQNVIPFRINGNESYRYRDNAVENPLFYLPEYMRENVVEEYYEPGYSSALQEHFLKIISVNGNGDTLQRIVNDLYNYAIRKNSHFLAHNVILVLSQLPFSDLGTWASTLAIAATRSAFKDVQEMGIRCFDNWEDKVACEFLRECRFSEKWLQEYADDVCGYILGEGVTNVLSAQNNAG